MTHISLVELAQQAISQVLADGVIAIDATVGNGYDTLFLAQGVSAQGRVYGLDIQPAALEAARQRLAAAGVLSRVTLLHEGHERLATVIPERLHGQVQAIMFNLGYLPGGDKSLTTQAVTTVMALQAAITLLAPGGRISVVAYAGHPRGSEEAAALRRWMKTLNNHHYHVAYTPPPVPAAPELYVIDKADR